MKKLQRNCFSICINGLPEINRQMVYINESISDNINILLLGRDYYFDEDICQEDVSRLEVFFYKIVAEFFKINILNNCINEESMNIIYDFMDKANYIVSGTKDIYSLIIAFIHEKKCIVAGIGNISLIHFKKEKSINTIIRELYPQGNKEFFNILKSSLSIGYSSKNISISCFDIGDEDFFIAALNFDLYKTAVKFIDSNSMEIKKNIDDFCKIIKEHFGKISNIAIMKTY